MNWLKVAWVVFLILLVLVILASLAIVGYVYLLQKAREPLHMLSSPEVLRGLLF